MKGSALTGNSLIIDGETLVLSQKSKWYEIFLAVFPLIFLLIWGNSSSLCAIFPVVGGAIGGALGGLSLCISLFLMKKETSRMAKVLVGFFVCVLTIMISFVLALTIIYLPA